LPSAYLHGVGTPEWSKLSRLDTRPARSPVNASPPASRPTAHDSGPVWVATPSPYETSIRNTSPVLPAHGDMLETRNVFHVRLAHPQRSLDPNRRTANDWDLGPGVLRSCRSVELLAVT